MRHVPGDIVEIDDEPILGDCLDLDSNEEYPRPETADPQSTDEQAQDVNGSSGEDPDYLDRAKLVYDSMGAPAKFIEFAAGILMRLDALEDPRCNTHEKEMLVRGGLGLCVDAALTELIVSLPPGDNRVAALALEIRALAPDAFDRWVNLQFTVGKSLAMMTARRRGCDMPRERFIEEQLKEGQLVAGAVMTEAAQFESFVGILRLTLEAELNIKTVNEQIELDLALKNYLLARRFAFTAQSLIPPSGILLKDLGKNLDLMDRVGKFDKNFQVTIDRMRARNRHKLKTVRLAVEKRVTLSVTATPEELDERTAMSA